MNKTQLQSLAVFIVVTAIVVPVLAFWDNWMFGGIPTTTWDAIVALPSVVATLALTALVGVLFVRAVRAE